MKKIKKAPKGEAIETSTSKNKKTRELSESELDTVAGGAVAAGGAVVAAAPAAGGTYTSEVELSSFSFGAANPVSIGSSTGGAGGGKVASIDIANVSIGIVK
jgi:hypothetical protein